MDVIKIHRDNIALLAVLLINFLFKFLLYINLTSLYAYNLGVIFYDFANIILLFLIGKNIFSKTTGLISALIYAISPWTIYYSLHGSQYILVLFIVELITLLLLYFRNRVIIFVSILVFCIPLLLWQLSLAGLFSDNENIFNKPLLLADINKFQGYQKNEGVYVWGRLIENKYIYVVKDILIKQIYNFAPGVYFSPQYKLVDFSFSPPIFITFLFPLIYLISKLTKKGLLIVGILAIILSLPSTITNHPPKLEELLIISPLIFLLIGEGINRIINNHTKLFNLLKILLICVFVGQMLFTIFDISTRETIRFNSTYHSR